MTQNEEMISAPSLNMIDLVNKCKNILETIFPEQWFQNGGRENHIAFENWKLCNDILKRGTIRFQSINDPLLQKISQLISDCLIFIEVTNGNLKTFELGDTWAISENFFLSEIQPRLIDNKLYLNTIFELSALSWYKSENFNPSFPGQEGYPDIVAIDQKIGDFFIECKKIDSTSIKQILKEIDKAKDQILNTGENSVGIILINIDSAISKQKIPAENRNQISYKLITDLKEKLIHKNWPHIFEIIVTWNDFQITQQINQEFLIEFICYSTSIKINNKDEEIANYQYTGYSHSFKIVIENMLPIFANKKIDCLSSFTEQVIKPMIGLPKEKIIDSVFQYDKIEKVYENIDEIGYLVGRHYGKPPTDFYLILGISEKADELTIIFGLKVPLQSLDYDHQFELSQMLKKIIIQFGLPISIKGYISRYYENNKVIIDKYGERRPAFTVHTMGNEKDITMGYFRIYEENNEIYAEFKHFFALNIDAYIKFLKTTGVIVK